MSLAERLAERKYKRAIAEWEAHYTQLRERAIRECSSGDYILSIDREKNATLARITAEYHKEELSEVR